MKIWEAIKLPFQKKNRLALKDAAARDPKKVAIAKVGQAIKTGGSSEFEAASVDLEEIQRAYFTDSYIRRAVDKYSELMFKEKWEIPGKNPNATEYVWTRLKLMAEATGQPTEEFMKEIAHDLVLFGNVFIVKARQKGSSAATGVNAQGYSGKQPIAGYFVLPAPTVQIARDDNGKILNYQQSTGSGDTLTFAPTEVIHFHYKRPRGHAFGVPMIYNVMDDVKILRQIEENVARLIYRNLFPLYQYKIGIDKPGYEATDEEIDELREEIRNMPMDGGIVVPERHDITVIGAQGQAIDASEYLQYFRQRVFTGLAVSETVMGIGGTANRSTADNQSADLFDGVKEFQSIYANAFTFHIINELLFEGGFDPVINPDDEVTFSFFEIQQDAKIKKENHAVQLFTQNAITHEELRQELGRDPVTDEGRLYFNMITAALSAQTAQDGVDAANNAGDNKDKPANQSGKKTSPGNAKRESIEESYKNGLTENSVMVTLQSELNIQSQINDLHKLWDNLRQDVTSMMLSAHSMEHMKAFGTKLVKQSMESKIRPLIEQAISSGILSGQQDLSSKRSVNESDRAISRNALQSKIDRDINRLMNDIEFLVTKASEQTGSERITTITAVFESNQYRLAFMVRSQINRGYNLGRVLYAKASGKEFVVSRTNSANPNPNCQERAGKRINLQQPMVDLIEQIPAYHPNCECTIDLLYSAEEVS